MRLMAQAYSLLISQCDGGRLAEEIAMSAICQYCNKRASARRAIALSSTWHRCPDEGSSAGNPALNGAGELINATWRPAPTKPPFKN
jgi:hypothetical protein